MTRTRGIVSAISIAVALGAAFAAGVATTSDSDEAAIRAVGKSWIEAYADGDFATIPDLYTEDAWVMPRGRSRIVGRDALRQALGGLAGGRNVTIDVKERELVVHGDMAWFISDFKVTYSSDDAATPAETSYGRSLIIYRRGEDGRWRVHRDIDSPAPKPVDGVTSEAS